MKTIGTAKKPRLSAYSLASFTWFNAVSGPKCLLRDRSTFVGSLATKLQISNNLDSGAPTWTDIYTFPGNVGGVCEMHNGELMVGVIVAGIPASILVSNGWAANPATATWTKVLTCIGGDNAIASYCLHQYSHGTDGTVLISEGGPQTQGGAGNATSDLKAARRVYLSDNFGLDGFKGAVPIFDIYAYGQSLGIAYPGGVHLHGVAYDQDDGRIYVCYGDDNGVAPNIAGSGNNQVVYSDDRGVTWNKLTMGPNFAATGSIQMLNCTITKNAVIFTPDVSNPKVIVIYPKKGYRNLGAPIFGPLMSQSGVSGQNLRASLKEHFPLFFCGQEYYASGYTTGRNWNIPVTDDDGLTWSNISGRIEVQTPAITSWGWTAVWGPTVRGKVVLTGGMYDNNDNTKRSAVADLIRPSDSSIPFVATRKVAVATAMTADDQIILADATAGSFAVTPPPLSATNKTFTVKKPAMDVSSNAVTIAGMDGATVSLSTPGASVSFVSDGAAFSIIAKV
jgi:hypothetical protein